MTQINGDPHTIAGFNAGKYIGSIRSAAKKQYARTYLNYVLKGRRVSGPDRGKLSAKAARAVRMRMDRIFERPSS